MRFLTPFLIPLCLSACTQKSNETKSALSTAPSAIRATGDISLPETMTKAAFLPNPITDADSAFNLNLPGDILLLSGTGELWRTTTEGEVPAKFSSGPFTDILGYSFGNSNGVALARDGEGRVSAFLKTDPSGDLVKAPLSFSEGALSLFCAGSPANNIWVVDSVQSLRPLAIELTDDNVIELSLGPPVKTAKHIEACQVLTDGTILGRSKKKDTWHWYAHSDSKVNEVDKLEGATNIFEIESLNFVGLSDPNNALNYWEGDVISSLLVEDGLSIRGIKNANFVVGTNASMGTAFNDGLIILSDADEPRLVMISLDYAKTALGDAQE